MNTINTFKDGLNFDTSQNKRPNSVYYDALDVRVISNDALSNEALVNFNGTKAKVDLNTRSNSLVGYSNVDNTLVLFLVNGDGDSLIYKIDLDNTDTTQSMVLIYSDTDSVSKLNFSVDNKIIAVGRYETQNIRKVYWVDGFNELRYVNLDKDYTGLESFVFDSTPKADISVSITSETKAGGNYQSGVVQHAYQLYSKNGAATTVSQLSSPIKLSSYGEYSEGGNELEDSVYKSILVSIGEFNSDIIASYNRIRIYSIFYSENNLDPTINIVGEYSFSSESFSVVDIGNSIGTIDLSEFISLKQVSYVPRTLSSKDNYLIAGNINESLFSSDAIDDWDSRAYRFQASTEIRRARIEDINNGNYIYVTTSGAWTEYDENSDPTGRSGSSWTVPSDFDCANKYNDIYNDGDNYEYKYVVDGISIGGEGLNVKYTLITYHKDFDTAATEASSTKVNKSDFCYSTYTSDEDSVMTDLQSGEVYRVGIKFINSKGQSSFVKWVGDIRTPDSFGEYSSYGKVGFLPTTQHVSFSVAVKMEITPPDDSDIVGWQVVRAIRKPSDRTVIASGLITPTVKKDSDEDFHRMFAFGTTESTYTTMVNNYFQTVGLTTYTASNRLFKFISPDTMFNDPDNKSISNYKIKVNNRYSGYQLDHNYTTLGGTANYSFASVKLNSLDSLNVELGLFEISDYVFVKPQVAQTGLANRYSFLNDGTTSYNYLNQAIVSGTDDFGGSCSGLILLLTSDLTPNALDGTVAENGNYFYSSLINDVYLTRYGGSSYELRSNSEYIDFSEIKAIADTSCICKNGDTYTTMFSLMNTLFFDSSSSNDEGYQELLTIPIESTIDCRYRLDRLINFYSPPSLYEDKDSTMFIQETVAKGIEYQPDVYDEEIGDLYRYNDAYSNIGGIIKSYPKPIDFDSSESIITKIIYSEKKSNGESEDNWTKFLSSSFIEVDSEFGKVSALHLFGNKLYFFQDRAFGRLAVNDRSLISDDSGAELSLGTGGVLERYDYINNSIGTIDHFHSIKTKNDIYFIDVLNKDIHRLSDQSISMSLKSGINSFVRAKINEAGEDSEITIGYDPEYNEVLFTINGETICYNDNTKSFVSKYSTAPKEYLSLYNGLFSYIEDEDLTGDDRYVYQHNMGDVGSNYSETKSNHLSTSNISVLVNPNGNIIDKYETIDFRFECDSESVQLDYFTIESISVNLINYPIEVVLYESNGVDVVASYDSIAASEVVTRTIDDDDIDIVDIIKVTPSSDISDLVIKAFDTTGIAYIIYSGAATQDNAITVDVIDEIDNTYGLIKYRQMIDNVKFSNSYIADQSVVPIIDDPSRGINGTISSLITGYRMHIPITPDGNRFVDSYVLITFEFNNRDNLKFKMHDLITSYSIANR